MSAGSAPGLSVTVSPSASAFFAGELFTATVTFRNTHPPAPPHPPPGPHPPHGLAPAPARTPGHGRTASSFPPGAWQRPPTTPPSNRTRTSQVPGYFDSAVAPADTSPYGSALHPSLGAAASTSQLSPTPAPRRSPNPPSAYSGGALDTPQSATFSLPPPPYPPSRTPSFASSSSAGPGGAPLPTRKGLIGKPAAPAAPAAEARSPAGGSGGLYPGGPRRPGGLLRGGAAGGHGRAQSMAVSSPNLLLGRNGQGERNFSAPPGAGTAAPAGGHAKGRFGGSVVGQQQGFTQKMGSREDLRGSAREPAALIHEDFATDAGPQLRPDHPDDAAFPVSQSTSSPGAPHFPRRPTFGHQRTPSNYGYPYSSSGSRARLSTLSLASDGTDSAEDYTDEDDAHAQQQQRSNGRALYGMGRNDTMDSVAEASYAQHAAAGHGGPDRVFSAPSGAPGRTLPPLVARAGHERHRSISHNGAQLALPASAEPPAPLHLPNTLSVLWAFAHLEGSFVVDESLIKPAEFLEVKRLLVGGAGGVGVGGGTLEERKTGGGWRSWLWGGGAGSAGTGLGTGSGGSGGGDDAVSGGASLEERKRKAIEDRSVPMLSCPPSILGVDVVLKPGESKSYTYSIRIPADLPPSFRGKSIKFNYHLVVGSNRVALGPAVPTEAPRAGRTKGSVSRVMRVPLRVYNHVGVTGARPFYDLTNPVIFQRDEAATADVDDPKEKAVQARKVRRPAAETGKHDFETYATTLLDSVVTNSPELVHNPGLSPTLEATRSPELMEAPPALRPEMSSHRGGGAAAVALNGEGFGVDVDEANGCKAAVEIVSRNSQKVSYDINKDGYQVASLTLVKSAYRLGETVNGSVLINGGEGRVLRVSARLETHELVETSISTLPAPRMRQITRRLHAEHHEMVLDSARIGFALGIPSGATPDFGTSGVKLQWSIRLSFLVIPPSPDAPDSNSNPNLAARRSGGPGAPNGRGSPSGTATPPRHGRSKSFAYGFEPAVSVTLPPAPMIAPSGAAHLMPVPAPRPTDPTASTALQHVSYRAVPDLGYVPVPFSSAAPDPPPAPGPLQKTARGAQHRPTPSVSMPRHRGGEPGVGSVVLVPAKVETVECSIPIKCYPGNTPFRPTISIFEV
ncbi:uncharacterized protein JCM10292_000493 [Rhodotorula paludigena]|uniref:uncharacterized protein n=1 Tax=Rhodotorula paludigena TaxID=86838 RepID=UPI00316F5301